MGQRKPPGPVTGQECTTLASFSLVFSDVILGHISPDHRMSSIALVGQNESSRTFSKSLSRFLRLRSANHLGFGISSSQHPQSTQNRCYLFCLLYDTCRSCTHTLSTRRDRLKGGLVALVPHVGRGLMFPPQGLGIHGLLPHPCSEGDGPGCGPVKHNKKCHPTLERTCGPVDLSAFSSTALPHGAVSVGSPACRVRSACTTPRCPPAAAICRALGVNRTDL